MVQQEMERRRETKNRYSGNGMFASRIVCGECGSSYGPKVWHSNSKYRKVIYQCNNKFKNKEKCKTPHIDEETIKELYVEAVNKLIVNKKEILDNLELIREKLTNTSGLDLKHQELKS